MKNFSGNWCVTYEGVQHKTSPSGEAERETFEAMRDGYSAERLAGFH